MTKQSIFFIAVFLPPLPCRWLTSRSRRWPAGGWPAGVEGDHGRNGRWPAGGWPAGIVGDSLHRIVRWLACEKNPLLTPRFCRCHRCPEAFLWYRYSIKLGVKFVVCRCKSGWLVGCQGGPLLSSPTGGSLDFSVLQTAFWLLNWHIVLIVQMSRWSCVQKASKQGCLSRGRPFWVEPGPFFCLAPAPTPTLL